MIDTRALTWGPAGVAANQLTAIVTQGACAAVSATHATGLAVLALIGGLANPSSGQILLDGHDVTADPAARRRETFCAHPNLPALPVTVREYLELASAGRRGSDAQRAATPAIADLDLTRRVDALDEAARQTIGLAAALASGAAILLLHTPFATGGADDHARRRALITEARHRGHTLLITGVNARDPLVDLTIEAGR